MLIDGYLLLGTVTHAERVDLTLREPAGKVPVRIRIMGPRTLELPEIPAAGLEIAEYQWFPSDGDGERVVLKFVGGDALKGTGDQILIDTFR